MNFRLILPFIPFLVFLGTACQSEEQEETRSSSSHELVTDPQEMRVEQSQHLDNDLHHHAEVPDEQLLPYLQFLEGAWEADTGEEEDLEMGEVWEAAVGYEVQGFGWTIQNGDTTSFEELKLAIRGKQLVLTATVHQQNNGQPVEFKSSSIHGETVTYINEEHDWPQKFVYRYKGANELQIEIGDLEDAEPFVLRLYRVPLVG